MTDALGAYLDRIGRIPLLNASEEVELARRMERGRADDAAWSGDADEARQQFFQANLRLVVSLARRYPTSPRIDLLDLIQAGNMALWGAVEAFEWQRGFRFSTFATYRIRQALARCLDTAGPSAKIPIDTASAVRSALRHHDGDLEALPTELQSVVGALTAASLDQPVGEASSLGAVLADATTSVEDIVVRRDRDRRLHGLLAELPEHERIALRLRFGLDGGRERTLAELAAVLSCTPADASRSLGAAKQRLRALAGDGRGALT